MPSEFFVITLSTVDKGFSPPRQLTVTHRGLKETDNMTREEVFEECQRQAVVEKLRAIALSQTFDVSTSFYHIEPNVPENIGPQDIELSPPSPWN